MTPIISPVQLMVLAVFLTILWLLTTTLFVRIVKRNDKITDTAKTIWSILIVIYWVGGLFGYLVWNLIWQLADKFPTQKLSS